MLVGVVAGLIAIVPSSASAAPVGVVYANGQHRDDATLAVPAGATSVEVLLLNQTGSLDYVQFLSDENVTNSNGQILWDQYFATGMSAPVEIGITSLALAAPCPEEMNNDGFIDSGDISAFVTLFLAGC